VLVAPGAVLDFESQSVFDLRVRVTDAGGLSSEQTLRVTLGDVAEAAAQTPAEATDASAQVPTQAPTPPTALLSASASNGLDPSLTALSTEAELFRRAPTERGARLPSNLADGEGADGSDGAVARLRSDAASSADVSNRGSAGANDATSAQRAHPRQRDGAFGLFASLVFDGAGSFGAAAIDAWSETSAANGTDTALRSNSAAHRSVPIEADTAGTARDAGEHHTPATLGEIVRDPVRVSSVAFSAGFIWWLTRSGGLLMTMLMGIPAWRHIDLLPVLARPIDDEDDDEDTHRTRPGSPRSKNGNPRSSDATDSELDPASASDLAVDGLFDRGRAAAQLGSPP
jgi:hypothetical protein